MKTNTKRPQTKTKENSEKEAIINKARIDIIAAFQKMCQDIETKPAPCDGSNYEVKAALIWKFRQEEVIIFLSIPLPVICNAFNISVTYYNQLKAIHQYEWVEMFKNTSMFETKTGKTA